MGSLFLRFPEGKLKAFTFSYDDGVETDLRFIDILRQHNLKGTFNIGSKMFAPEGTTYAPGTVFRHMTKSQRAHAYDGMEVAIHGSTHPFLESLPSVLCVNEILNDRQALEEEYGCIVNGMAYPFGTFSDTVLEVLKLCGITYSRTTRATHSFRLPQNWLLLDPTCHHNDPELFNLCDKFLNENPAATSSHAPWMFYVWGHTYEFDGNNNWDLIEEFAEKISGHPDVWYATNGEIRDYVAAFDSLVFSVDGSRIYNPSNQTVWFEYGGHTYSVQPGETLKTQK